MRTDWVGGRWGERQRERTGEGAWELKEVKVSLFPPNSWRRLTLFSCVSFAPMHRQQSRENLLLWVSFTQRWGEITRPRCDWCVILHLSFIFTTSFQLIHCCNCTHHGCSVYLKIARKPWPLTSGQTPCFRHIWRLFLHIEAVMAQGWLHSVRNPVSAAESCPHSICVNRGSYVSAISSFQSWVSVTFDSPPMCSTTRIAAHAAPVLTNTAGGCDSSSSCKESEKKRAEKKLQAEGVIVIQLF